MPRPLRIEYPNAFYHVMNRGRSRNDIFFKPTHYFMFTKILEESCSRFNCVIHSYCLMPNHYHLLIQTGEANLSRIMGYINGVYTQRFNRVQKVDGPLFRGRYKSILVDSDNYLLELTKYIHRNPIQTKNKQDRLVNNLCDYQWSSYQHYLGIKQTPQWINTAVTLSQFDRSDQVKRYQLFVERADNLQLQAFFDKKNQEAILGSTEFKEKVLDEGLVGHQDKQEAVMRQMVKDITIKEIVRAVADIFNVSEESIMHRQKGRPRRNIPRGLVMYLMQETKGINLKKIAEIFGLKHYGSVSFSISQIRKEINKNNLLSEINEVKNVLYFKQQA